MAKAKKNSKSSGRSSKSAPSPSTKKSKSSPDTPASVKSSEGSDATQKESTPSLHQSEASETPDVSETSETSETAEKTEPSTTPEKEGKTSKPKTIEPTASSEKSVVPQKEPETPKRSEQAQMSFENPEKTGKPEKHSAAPKKTQTSWTNTAIAFNTVGILFGLSLIVFGGTRSFYMIDGNWFHWLGETKAYVLEASSESDGVGKERQSITIWLPQMGKFPEAKVRVYHERLYHYLKHRVHPPRRLQVMAYRVQRVMSGQAGVAQVGPIGLIQTPKSSELILFIGLFVLGGAICFTSLRDLRKRWLRRDLPT